MRSRLVVALVATLFAGGVARAEDDAGDEPDKYFFFSKPEVTAEQAGADWDQCRELVSQVQPPAAAPIYYANPGGAAGLAAAAAVGFVQGFIRAGQRRHMVDAALRKCMHVKGYGRYAMTKDEAKAMYDGGWDQIRPRLVQKAVAAVGEAERLDP